MANCRARARVLLYASLTLKFERFEGASGIDGLVCFDVRVIVRGLMCKTSLNARILSCR